MDFMSIPVENKDSKVAGLSAQDYYKQYNKKYYEANKQYFKEYSKNYYEINREMYMKKVECPVCKRMVHRTNLHRHRKSHLCVPPEEQKKSCIPKIQKKKSE